jgi:hypothetical protein
MCKLYLQFTPNEDAWNNEQREQCSCHVAGLSAKMCVESYSSRRR